MKSFRTLTVLLVCMCLSAPTTLMAQNTSTQGKEFWLSFMQNGFRNHPEGYWITTQVLISAKRDCTGTVSNPLTGWSQSFSVHANNITTVDIPEAQGYHGESDYETITQKAIKVVSSDTISVYCTNIAQVSFDASFVLPIGSLGDEYMIQSYDQSTAGSMNDYVTYNETSAFLIVATENNTSIDITPTCATLSGHQAGQTYSITLNEGETYQVRSTRTGNHRDLSGTHIVASDCKKIAVFNGNTLTCIPINMHNGYDHVFEQAMPLRSWGKRFVVTCSRNRNRDFIKITSSADNNTITRDGNELVTLGAGESYTFYMEEAESSCFLQAEQPCAVYLFNNSSYDLGFLRGLGDPSMVWIAPVEQRINEVTFSTFDNYNINIETHSVNIIVNTEDISNVYFDGQQISPLLFSHVTGNNDYSYVRMDITHGVHHISCTKGFNAHVYGFGNAKGYAYLVGSNAKDLSTNITLNDLSVQAGESFPYCIEEPVTFSADVNFQDYNVLWYFGDGTTSTDNPTTHVYHDRRLYEAYLYVETDASGCLSGNSDTLNFFVDLTQQYITESDVTCAGEVYSGHGFSNILINNDTILSRLQDNPDNPECKDSLLLYLTAHSKYYTPINDSRCWRGNPAIYDDYGFGFEYDAPGIFERTLELQTTQGCDSIVSLTLTVDDQITYDFSHFECSGSYVWDGIEYNATGDYDHVYTAANGCDSIVTCHLLIGGIVEGITTTAEACDQYEWEGSIFTETGPYSFTHSTALGCDSVVHLNLTINRSPHPVDISPVSPENLYPHWVVTATEFQINSYDFQLWDQYSTCVWDSLRWEFEDPNMLWLLEPDSTTNPVGKRCKMYVLDYVEDTVWLRATVYNQCNPQGIERRYWFVCSFYGIDDYAATDSEAFNVDVIPNPNNGAMRIYLGEMEGRVNVAIYNMQGQAIDRFDLTTIPQNLVEYDMRSQKNGIYFFVFNHNGNVVTKKVIITK